MIAERLSIRDKLASIFSGVRTPREDAAAIGAAQLKEPYERIGMDPGQAAKMSRMVALGRATMGYRNGLDAACYQQAVLQLAMELLIRQGKLLGVHQGAWFESAMRRFGQPLPTVDQAAVVTAIAALHEHVYDVCPTCSGAREVRMIEETEDGRQPMIECSACNGTGKRTYETSERIAALDGFVDKKHARDRIQVALKIIRDAETETIFRYQQILK